MALIQTVKYRVYVYSVKIVRSPTRDFQYFVNLQNSISKYVRIMLCVSVTIFEISVYTVQSILCLPHLKADSDHSVYIFGHDHRRYVKSGSS